MPSMIVAEQGSPKRPVTYYQQPQYYTQNPTPSPLPSEPGTTPTGFMGTWMQIPNDYTMTSVRPLPLLRAGPTSPLSPLPPDPSQIMITGKKSGVYEITMEKKPEVLVYAPDPYFGLEVQYPYEGAPESLKKQAVLVNTYNPESRAMTGLGLATTAGVGVAVPILGAGAVAAIGVGETVAVGVAGRHLTVEEAVTLAGIGEVATAGALLVNQKYIQPRVQSEIESSYRQSVENFELWKPNVRQQVAMKVTGAQPPRLAQEIVAAGEAPPLSFKMLNQKTLGGVEEAYFWDMPTPKSSQVYVAGSVGSRAKMWAGEQLIRRVSGGLSYALIQTELGKEIKSEMPFIPKEPYILEAENVGVSRISPFLMVATSPSEKTTTRLTQQLMTRQALLQESNQQLGLSQDLAETQMQSQVQIQRQMLSQAQLLQLTQVTQQMQRNQFLTPTLVFAIPAFPKLSLPSSKDWLDAFMPPPTRSRQGYGLFLWEFPVAGPERALRELLL